MWDFKSGKKETVNKLSKHVHCVAFDEEGTLMASAGACHLKLWYFRADGEVAKQKSDKDDIFIIEPKSMFLNDTFQDKTFVDIRIYQKTTIFTITADSQLCLFNEATRQLDRWMDLKAAHTYSLALYHHFLVCASSDSIIRVFSTQNFKHITTLHSNLIHSFIHSFLHS